MIGILLALGHFAGGVASAYYSDDVGVGDGRVFGNSLAASAVSGIAKEG